MNSAYLDTLRREIGFSLRCECEHLFTSTVEVPWGVGLVWTGDVETFRLSGFPDATEAYAWGYQDPDGKIKYVVIPKIGPAISPRRAVTVAIAKGELTWGAPLPSKVRRGPEDVLAAATN